jgi:predicted  nucleic acid-binding Zn-ribbon protein
MRWSAGRKKAVVLRLLRGEPVDAVSREVAVPIYKLEQWRDRALTGIDAGLKERENDPLEKALDEAKRRIGELVMEVEILQKERRAKRPLVGRRSSR